MPITLTAIPRASVYELPDGRRVVCLRLWSGHGAERRCVPLRTLLAYAETSGLEALAVALRGFPSPARDAEPNAS